MTLMAALQGKVILVSGAGRPAGRSLALALAQSGATLALHDLALLPLEETAQQVQALGAVCRTYVADGGKGLPVRNLLDEVLNDFERLDGVVHAIFVRPQGRLLDLDEWDWQRSLELNLTGPLLLLQNAAPLLQEQGVRKKLHQDFDPEQAEEVIEHVLADLRAQPLPLRSASSTATPPDAT